jgi:predicted HAD superfamily Cof-like phosphohydrolase
MFNRVFEFNQHIVGINPRPTMALEPNEKKWLVGALHEEADELAASEAIEDQIDALVDSIIFSMGGLYRLGLTEAQAQACFHAVMDANFEKKAGQKAGRVVEGVKDAVKPEGWVGPEARIREILNGQN